MVYIVMESVLFEGSWIVDVFDSEEKAQARIDYEKERDEEEEFPDSTYSIKACKVK